LFDDYGQLSGQFASRYINHRLYSRYSVSIYERNVVLRVIKLILLVVDAMYLHFCVNVVTF